MRSSKVAGGSRRKGGQLRPRCTTRCKTSLRATTLLVFGVCLLGWPGHGSSRGRSVRAAADKAVGTPVVLESHVSQRPADAGPFIATIVRTLGKPVRHGQALRDEVERRMSRPAGSAASLQEIRAAVKEGRRQLIEGNFAAAITVLKRARERLMQQTAAVAADQTLRDTLHKTLLFLTHAHLRAGQGQLATERVSEVIRSFPDRDLSLVKHGPDLASFYRKVRQEMDRQGRGSLTIEVGRPGCMVFVNERFVGLSPARVVDLYPGQYRVYVQRAGQGGRIHTVSVEGGNHQQTLSFDLDRVLRSRPYVGLMYDSAAVRQAKEVRDAAMVARKLEAPLALVLGFHQHMGRRALQGTVVSADTGRVVRSGLVALEPAAPSAQSLQALGQFLVEGIASTDVFVRYREKVTPPIVKQDQGDQGGGLFSAPVLRWVFLGLAVGCAGAGVPLLAMHGQTSCDQAACPEEYDTLAGGVTLVAAAAVAAAASGVMFYLAARREAPAGEDPEANPGDTKTMLLPWAAPGGAGLTATVTF